MGDSTPIDATENKSGGATATAVRDAKLVPRPAARKGKAQMAREPDSAAAPRTGGPSFFDLYKRGQGYYTRMGTAVGAGAIILAGAHFLWNQLSVFRDDNRAWTLWLQTGIPLGVAVGLGLLVWWLVGVNRRTCDFMIATEGEMKKVNWSSRREIFGSTKVVILFTLLIGAILFVVDLLFMSFFAWVGVLREAPSVFKALFGGPT